MKKKLVLVLVVVTMIVGSLFAGAQEESTNAVAGSAVADGGDFISTYLAGKGTMPDGSTLTVGMVYADLISEYVINLSEYAKLLLESAGADVITTTSNMDVKLEDSIIDDLIQKDCDAVIIHAVDSNGSSSAIKRLNDAGIAVIAVIRKVSDVKMDLYVSTSNNVVTGQKAAQFLVDASGGEKVKVTSVQGYMGASDAYEREDGYEIVFADNPNINYVSQNPCEWDSQKAEAAISDALTSNPDLWGILSHSDCMAPGVYSALAQAGKTAKVGEPGHIYWSSIDGAPYALDLIRDGILDSTVEQSPLSVATHAVKGILNFVAQGKEIGEKSVDVQTTYVNKENVNDPARWGNYDIKSKGIWVKTEDVWNAELN